MGMNIKDPQVHAMARQLAAQRGTTVTDAVYECPANLPVPVTTRVEVSPTEVTVLDPTYVFEKVADVGTVEATSKSCGRPVANTGPGGIVYVTVKGTDMFYH